MLEACLDEPIATRLTLQAGPATHGSSLGRAFVPGALETRRHLLENRIVRAGEVSDDLGVLPGSSLARRTYAIVTDAPMVAVVTVVDLDQLF